VLRKRVSQILFLDDNLSNAPDFDNLASSYAGSRIAAGRIARFTRALSRFVTVALTGSYDPPLKRGTLLYAVWTFLSDITSD